MTGMVEVVAKALCAHDELDWDAQADPLTSGSGGNDQDFYRGVARAAIEAMRSATPEMLLAGGTERTDGWVVLGQDSGARREAPQYIGANGAERMWRAMIDAALSEPTEHEEKTR